VNAIDGDFEPYLVAPPAEPWYSEDAAAAAAAHEVLVWLLPGRTSQLDAFLDASLASIPDGPSKEGGKAVGEAAGQAMISARTDDGRFGDTSFTEGFDAGEWRALAAGLAGNNLKWIGDVKEFLVPDAEMFATSGPLPLASDAYTAEFDQVKSLGSATSTTRTPDQTAMARFWADHATAMWNRIFRQLSMSEGLSVTKNARFFAMLYLTGADAAISCFQDKERWHFWRPLTAIVNADTDGNPATDADTTWTPLLGNPPYPDHPSGHNCLSSSIVETLKDFFGTNHMSFSATHATLGTTRTFDHFSQAIAEIRLARVYAGIHFMTADAQGASLGKQVAKFREEHYFQPVS
ncbi:MAG TPA: vanadium-dependent haloperoxidase, partial [Actinomycetota bacterium]|nr:vanadium-dependent haloperoxidase [Actinomycetota bacterium]